MSKGFNSSSGYSHVGGVWAVGVTEPRPFDFRGLRPLPEDLRADATVYRYNADSGEREILREGDNHVECEPRSDDGFTWCYPTSTVARRDLRARLVAEGLSSEEVTERITAAEMDGVCSHRLLVR